MKKAGLLSVFALLGFCAINAQAMSRHFTHPSICIGGSRSCPGGPAGETPNSGPYFDIAPANCLVKHVTFHANTNVGKKHPPINVGFGGASYQTQLDRTVSVKACDNSGYNCNTENKRVVFDLYADTFVNAYSENQEQNFELWWPEDWDSRNCDQVVAVGVVSENNYIPLIDYKRSKRYCDPTKVWAFNSGEEVHITNLEVDAICIESASHAQTLQSIADTYEAHKSN